jgi:hypothetical protein
MLESSDDFNAWTPVGAQFLAEDEAITIEIETADTGRNFRVRQVP